MKTFYISRGKIQYGVSSDGRAISYSTKKIEYEEWIQIIERTKKFGWVEDEWKNNDRFRPNFVPKIQAITKYIIPESKLLNGNHFNRLQDSYSWNDDGILYAQIQVKKNMALLFEVAKLFEAEVYTIGRKLVLC